MSFVIMLIHLTNILLSYKPSVNGISYLQFGTYKIKNNNVEITVYVSTALL